MNTARLDVEREGVTETVREEILDPLLGLWTPGNHAHARVGLVVGTQVDFGRVKVSAVVNYECDQTTAAVDKAGILAFEKAVSFMNDGMTCLVGPVPT